MDRRPRGSMRTPIVSRLVRGWESQYSPHSIHRLRLRQARSYRDLNEEEGQGDAREGEVRIASPGWASKTDWEDLGFPIRLSQESQDRSDAMEEEAFRNFLAKDFDDPNPILNRKETGELQFWTNTKIEDSDLGSPFLLCLSKEPESQIDWDRLKASLPMEKDVWTVTADVRSLELEIRQGIKRWASMNTITDYQIRVLSGWVSYTYGDVPPSSRGEEAWDPKRWFRKRTAYQDQAEFRLAWELRSRPHKVFPDYIDIELNQAALDFFQPWAPPTATAGLDPLAAG